jgi:cyanophycinase
MATTAHTCLPIIGEAEDKVGRATVLRRVVRLAGGRGGRIVVIPSASSLPMRRCKTCNTAFGRLGAPQVVGGNPHSRQGTAREALVSAMDDAAGVLMAAATS